MNASLKRFRFGVTLSPTGKDRRQWIDEVMRCEADGFRVITVSDHFVGGGGVFAPLVLAHEVAQSLRVGTLVLNNDFWNPLLLAREVITADALTDGAFELGLGIGWDEEDYRAIGLERASPDLRIERLGEAFQILNLAFSGQPVRFEGKHYSVDGGDRWPKPHQPRIPILIGGGGHRILRLAARHADIVGLHRNLQKGVAVSWAAEKMDGTTERVSWIKESAGDRYPIIETHAVILRAVRTEHRQQSAAEIAAAHGLTPRQVLTSPHFLVGTTDQMVQDLLVRRQEWNLSYLTLLGTADRDAFLPVLDRLSGK